MIQNYRLICRQEYSLTLPIESPWFSVSEKLPVTTLRASTGEPSTCGQLYAIICPLILPLPLNFTASPA